jgi:hypothetical protein
MIERDSIGELHLAEQRRTILGRQSPSRLKPRCRAAIRRQGGRLAFRDRHAELIEPMDLANKCANGVLSLDAQ